MTLPASVRIIDITYRIEYVERPRDVDPDGSEELWGQVNYLNRTIRILDNGRGAGDIRQTLWHEIIHCICEKLHIRTDGGDLRTDELAVDLLATGINAALMDNAWLTERAAPDKAAPPTES